MNGLIIRKSVAMACLAACVPVLGGCYCYRDIVDPCWPERYNAMARHSVNDHFDAQACNGHIMDQTIWNYHFKNKEEDDPKTRLRMRAPTDELNYAGQQHLLYLMRRLPHPDGKIYLATARDLPIDTPVGEIAAKTMDLNNRRIKAIHEYVKAITTGYQQFPITFDVVIHDRAEPTVAALPQVGANRPTPTGALVDLWNQFQGSLPVSNLP